LKANFDRLITNYPSGIHINSLLASKLLNIKEEYICVGNGAAELIKILMDSFTGKFGVIYPTFEEYSRNIAQSKLVSYTPANENFSYSSQDLINYFDDKNIEMLCVINPDNPSGNFILIEDLIQLLTWAKSKNIKIIIDESFVDFTKGTDSNSLIKRAILEFFPNLIVIKSISKSYGVPGLRLGVLASANREIIQQMKKEISLWNINSIAEYFMQIFGKYEKEFKKTCSLFEEERNYFFSQLSGISFLRTIPSAANFFLCEVKPPFSSTQLTKILLCQKNILVKDCKFKKGFNGKDYIRLAIRSRNENAMLLKALAEIFESAQYQEPRLITSAPDF
jgi:histidinol-phosphate/aromatic aminotransferase/cobyric acid decarboxylase-like protein